MLSCRVTVPIFFPSYVEVRQVSPPSFLPAGAPSAPSFPQAERGNCRSCFGHLFPFLPLFFFTLGASSAMRFARAGSFFCSSSCCFHFLHCCEHRLPGLLFLFQFGAARGCKRLRPFSCNIGYGTFFSCPAPLPLC